MSGRVLMVTYFVLCLVVAAAIILFQYFGFALTSDAFKLINLIVFIVVLFGFYAAIIWWKGTDEAVKEAHKWAWYWGGSAGILVVLAALMLSLMSGDLAERYIAALGFSGHSFEVGLMAAMLPLMIGYGAAWGIWWLRHR